MVNIANLEPGTRILLREIKVKPEHMEAIRPFCNRAVTVDHVHPASCAIAIQEIPNLLFHMNCFDPLPPSERDLQDFLGF